MFCENCGKKIVPGVEHICIQSDQKVFKPKMNRTIPKPPPNTSPTFETTSVPLVGNIPNGLTLKDILSRKTYGTGFLSELRSIVSIWKRMLKKPTKANIILLVVGLLFFVIWLWTKYMPGAIYYTMPGGIKSKLAILLATFNNVPARVLHFSSLVTLGVAFIPLLASGQYKKVIAQFTSTYTIIRRMVSYKKSKTLYVAIVSLGTGLFFANYLMRNNSSNKYTVCLTLGITVLLSTGGLFNSSFIRLCNGIFNDIVRLLRVQHYITNYKIAIQVGFGSGLIFSYISCLLRKSKSTSFTDHSAYYFGIIIVFIGIVLIVTSPKKAGVTND